MVFPFEPPTREGDAAHSASRLPTRAAWHACAR
jgi:hypothetical protein